MKHETNDQSSRLRRVERGMTTAQGNFDREFVRQLAEALERRREANRRSS